MRITGAFKIATMITLATGICGCSQDYSGTYYAAIGNDCEHLSDEVIEISQDEAFLYPGEPLVVLSKHSQKREHYIATVGRAFGYKGDFKSDPFRLVAGQTAEFMVLEKREQIGTAAARFLLTIGDEGQIFITSWAFGPSGKSWNFDEVNIMLNRNYRGSIVPKIAGSKGLCLMRK